MLDWISQEDLKRIVNSLNNRISKARDDARKNVSRNVIDPFSALMVGSMFDVGKKVNLENILHAHCAIHGVSVALGSFHRDVLGSIEGWDNHDTGYDLINQKSRIIAEVKNKHNTLNSGGRKTAITGLDGAVKDKGKGWKGYLVTVIPKCPERKKDQLKDSNRPLWEIDGASFYTLATGQERALHDLLDELITQYLPKIPQEIENYCREVLLQSLPQ